MFFMLTSCETLQEPKVEYGPVYPLSGEWLVRFIGPKTVGAVVDTSAFATVSTFNAADNSTTSLWIRKTTSNAHVGAFTVKSTCDVAAKSFSGNALVNGVLVAGVSVGTCTVTDGLVTKDGWDTNSGYKSDKITFTIVDSRKPTLVYKAEGYRRTGWYEDEN